jgi:hypothetical protein
MAGFTGNPFSVDDFSGRLVVQGPDGTSEVPVFYGQSFLNVRHPGTEEIRAEPFECPMWQANWKPAREGRHRLQLEVRTGGGPMSRDLGEVTVAPASPSAGAVSAGDKMADRFADSYDARLFEYKNGRWARADDAAATGRYWNVRLDWTSAWGHYTGLGEFDQLLAWRFDEALTQSGSRIRLPVLVFGEDELDNQGKYNWVDHPLNRKNGGKLARPADVFTDQEATRIVLDRTRYLWARYRHYQAFSGVLLLVSRLERDTVDWINGIASSLAREFPGLRVFCNSPGLPERCRSRRLDLVRTWTTDPRLSPETQISRNMTTGEMAVKAPNADSAALVSRSVLHWAGDSAFGCDIFNPEVPDDELKVMCLVRTDPATVYQSRLFPLGSERWNRVNFPLDKPDEWICLQDAGRRMQPYDLMNVREVGLRFFGPKRENLSANVRDCVLHGPYRFEIEARPPLAIGDVAGTTNPVPQYGKFELNFAINRVFRNPYDPKEIEVTVEVTDPNGGTIRHPGFFREPWSLEMAGEREVAVRSGAPGWCVRVSPLVPGRHEWRVTVSGVDEKAEIRGSFVCVPGASPGFVRLAKDDPRYFEFSNGSFFYPIGHNLRSPGDSRSEKQGKEARANSEWAMRQGTRAYEKWFARMRENGENFTRVWMSPWWCGLEWNSQHSGYHGLGYYNQANAARLDRVLELAEKEGITVNLETMNHGALSTRIDEDWSGNPLNECTQRGGFLRYATQFFDSERALELHRNRLRYTIARWGYSRAIAWWGVMTETEWVEAYYRSVRGRDVSDKLASEDWVPRPYESHEHKQKVVDWIVTTGGYIRQTDAHPHPVSTHFSMPFYGLEVWHRPNVDVVHNNTYTESVTWWRQNEFKETDGIADVMFVFARQYDAHARRKPLMVGEWGGSPYGSPGPHLAAELHTGTWVMTMTRCAGTAGFWWWNFLDAENLYPHFKAVAAFMKGEDRRGKDYQSCRAALSFPNAEEAGDFGERAGILLYNENELLAYIYSKAMNRRNTSVAAKNFDDTAFPKSGEGRFEVPDVLKNGRYVLEYWNTFDGRRIRALDVKLSDGQRTAPVADHRVDLALKLRRKSE